MSAVFVLSVLFILINYNITIINSVAAAEVTTVPTLRSETPIEDVSTIENSTCNCEEVFELPMNIVFDGIVSGVFVGGRDLSVDVQGLLADDFKSAYIITKEIYRGELDEVVRVNGRGVGITCAYARTLGGECSLEVIADKVELQER